uniref:Putative transcriptional regulator n=1 Tax=Streptomyces sp. TA-0256 TaxID=573242 RepID=E5RLL0_9ACTN|nr:putative transcriptional regulator [Streptomyces sp. TA-0256]
MRFSILGSLEVYSGDTLVTPTSPKLRHVLAALILHANQPVRPASLIEELWHEPPASAATTLQTYIYRLRKKLGAYQRAEEEREVLVTINSSYLVRTRADQLDLNLFERLSHQGREALQDGRPDQASSLLDEALSLWRGKMLDGVSVGPLLEAHLVRFEEARLRAFEMRMEAGLQLGRHHELIAELKALTTSHPLHEGFPAQLMLALYRSDRRLEALEVYRSLRHRLVSELGVEPSGELVQLHQTILRADPSLNLPSGNHSVVQLRSAPAQLPVKAGPVMHQERAVQLEALLRATTSGRRGSSLPRVVSLHGMAGVGKSELALHVAHQLRSHFPDGQLYADLRDLQGHLVRPFEAIAGFLRAAGVQPERFGRLEERRERFRSWSADRKVLIILDNAESPEQVLPLLPGGPDCVTVVNSRSRLAGLRDEVALELSPLSADEGIQLLESLLSDGHGLPDRELAEQVVRLCGFLPAAICAAAFQLSARPQWGLRDLADWLTHSEGRLTFLTSPEVSLHKSFELSCRKLGQTGLQIFEQLASLPETFTREDLLVEDDVADRALKQLVECRLLEEVVQVVGGSYRPAYRCHELVRLYARERLMSAKGRLRAARRARLRSGADCFRPLSGLTVPGSGQLVME